MHYSHLFGPVTSRRLGSSLGVDMVPFKTCNFNCVYCECGAARPVSHERREYITAEDLINELDHYLSSNPAINYITFAGSGEPTLNSALGRVINHVKKHYPAYNTALLTNGTLLQDNNVQNELLPLDLILPSLDAASEEVFRKINCPHPNLHISSIIDGLITFSRRFTGQIWVELFIVPGSNDTPEEITRFKEVLTHVRVSRVQLNSLDRPGTCNWVQAATPERLAEIARSLQPLPVEIIARTAGKTLVATSPPADLSTSILHQLLRRPATIEEIAVFCSTTLNDIHPLLEKLVIKKKLTVTQVNGKTFYSVSKT